MKSSCCRILLRCRILMGVLTMGAGLPLIPALSAEEQEKASIRPFIDDPPAEIRDFSGGAKSDKLLTVDFFVHGSDGLCVPTLVTGGNLGIYFKLPGEDKERCTNIDEDGTYKGENFKYVLNKINLVPGDKTERARGFLPGEDYDPDPQVKRPATRLANRLLLNPEALFKRFVETFEAVEGIRPVPTGVTSGLEAYPQAPEAGRKKIIPPGSDVRYYSRGASPHVKFLMFKDDKVVLPFGNHVVLSCILWRRTEHTDFTAGCAVDLLGNRLPSSGIAAWGWQNGYGGLQYGDYSPGLGIHYFPALSLGESWDIRYNGNPHVLGGFQQEEPCYFKPLIWERHVYSGKAYASNYAPVVFSRVPPKKVIDRSQSIAQELFVFNDSEPWYAPQDSFNYDDDKIELMRWQRQGKGTARILRNGHFFQNGAALLFPGTDVPNSLRKPLDPEGLPHVTLTAHLFKLPEEGYDPNGAFLTVEFAKSPKLTGAADANGQLTVSRPGASELKTGLFLKTGWNPLSLIYDQESRRVYVRLGKDFAQTEGRRLTFPAEGGMTAMEIGKSVAPSEKGNVLFDAIWINPNDNLADNFEYASIDEMRGDAWKIEEGRTNASALVDYNAYSGKQALKLEADAKPVTLSRSLLPDLRDHSLQIAWFRETKGAEDSFIELRSSDGKSFLRLRGDEDGKLLYRTQSTDWKATKALFRPEFLEGWNELILVFDPDGNAYPILNLIWVAQENGLPLLIPNCGKLTELVVGRSGTPSGSDVLFDDLRLLRNWTLVGNATLYSSAFDYPLDADRYFKQHGWQGAGAAGARLEEGNAGTGKRCLALSGLSTDEMTRTFDQELRDVTMEFSWCHDPTKNIRVDAGEVSVTDSKGKRLSLSADEGGHVRYRVNEQAWVTTEYTLVNGWNKARIIIEANKPADIMLAPQRAGLHPKSQWTQAWFTYEKDKTKTDFRTNTGAELSGIARVAVRRQGDVKGDFFFDDLVVLTNKPTTRDLAMKGRAQQPDNDLKGMDARLRSRFWKDIEKILIERGLIKKEEK